MATILMTGATGIVGSGLASSLESKGHMIVYLTRPKNVQSAEERLYEILGRWPGGSRAIWEGDIIFPRCGVSGVEIQAWKGKIDRVIHCASSVSFDEVQENQTFTINVDGTNNVINLAGELGIPEIHYISTAYVAGDADFFTEKDFDIGQTFRNPYERSKFEAEGLVKKAFPKRFSIYRLGIVVGDFLNGYIPQFMGFYRPFSFFWQFRESLKEKTSDVLKRYKEGGVVFDKDRGMLALPVHITCSPVSTLNIIPRNWMVEVLSGLVEVSTEGQVFHVVDPNPKKIRWIVDATFNCLGINGYSYEGQNGDYNENPLLSRVQHVFDRDVKAYLPYIIHEARFTTVNVSRVLGDRYFLPPDIDETFLQRVLEYAKSVDFGRKKKIEVAGI